MIITFQTVLIVILLISAIGVVGSEENKGLREASVGIFMASLIAFIVSAAFL